MPGTGDELQGIKKGIMEMADVIALNKCDGDRVQWEAEQSAIELQGALQLMTRTQDHWQPPVLQISALHATGMEDMWSALDSSSVTANSTAGWINDVVRNRSIGSNRPLATCYSSE